MQRQTGHFPYVFLGKVTRRVTAVVRNFGLVEEKKARRHLGGRACLLPTVYCLLSTAYCLLPTAYFIGTSLNPAGTSNAAAGIGLLSTEDTTVVVVITWPIIFIVVTDFIGTPLSFLSSP